MKKEYIGAVTLLLFFFAYVLDYLAGPVFLSLKNPLVFFTKTYLGQYPLTAVAVFSRALALVSTLLLIFSAIDRKYFTKTVVLFSLAILAELYAIQQMATGSRVTSPQWTLSIAYAGALSVPPAIFYLFKGVFFSIHKTISPESEQSEKKDKSILDNSRDN